MLLIERLRRDEEKLSDGQREVARWLAAHRDEVPFVTVKRIAEQTYTSPATVVRLAKNLGYASFEPMRMELVKEIAYLDRGFVGLDPHDPFETDDGVMTIASKVASFASETVDDTLSLIDEATLLRAVDLIDSTRRLHVGATSFPLVLSQEFMLKMRRIGKDVGVTTLAGERQFTERIIQPDDCGLVISYSGTTRETLDLAHMYERCGIPIIAITSMGSNPLRELADVSLTLTTREYMHPDWVGVVSHLSMKLLLDTLYSCIYVRHLARVDESVR